MNPNEELDLYCIEQNDQQNEQNNPTEKSVLHSIRVYFNISDGGPFGPAGPLGVLLFWRETLQVIN